MSDKRAWRDYLAADEEYERADRRLRATAYEPALVRALASGPVDPALEFLSTHRPVEVLNRSLDLLLPLAIEGGSEQGQVRELVLAADRSTVVKALPALVARVVGGPDEGDEAYLAYQGLMDLLDRLGERELLRYVIGKARQSPDPEVHSAADDFDDDFGALDVHSGEPVLAPAPPPRRESPDAEAARAWEDYVRAQTRRNIARNEVLRRGFPAGLMSQPHPSGARLLAEVLGSDMYTPEFREMLCSLDTAALRETVSLIAGALLADHRLRAERYRALLNLLTEIPDTAGFAAARELARGSGDPEIRQLVP